MTLEKGGKIGFSGKGLNMGRTFSIQTMYLRWRDDLFFLAFTCLFFNYMFSQYIYFKDSVGNGVDIFSRSFYLLFLGFCLLSLIIRGSYSQHEIIAVGGLLILGALSYVFSGSHIFFDITLIMAIAKNIDFNRFMKRTLILLTLFTFTVICLSCLNILGSVVRERSDNTQMRYSLGFGHPNALGLIIFQIIAGVVILERKCIKTVHMWLLLAVGVIFYFITRSQTSLVAICLMILAVLIYKWLARKVWTKRQMKCFVSIILIIAVVITIIAVHYFWINPEAIGFSTLRDRIIFAQRYLNAYGVNLFGSDIVTGSNVVIPGYDAMYEALDNGEVWYLVRLGIVGCGVFFYTYIRMIIKTINKKEFVLCIVAVIYLVYSITEGTALRLPFNFMIVYAGIMLYSGNLLRDEKVKKKNIRCIRYSSHNKKIIGIHDEQIN